MEIRTDGFDSMRFTEHIRKANRIAITTHLNPDGDAIGSEIGLAEWLLNVGKKVSVVNHSPTPYNYLFLDEPNPIIEAYDHAKHHELLNSADLIIVLDVNDPARVRTVEPYVINPHHNVIVVDHHLSPKEFAKDYFIDTDASSTGEMIYKLIVRARLTLGGDLSAKGAAGLYTAIMTDTGSFKFPRTDAEVLRICADLIELGADPVRTYDETYNSSPPSRLLLQREALNSLRYYYDDRCAMQTVTQATLKSVGADEEAVDGFVQMPFQVKGVVLSILLLELREGWKISARSKGDVSAARLAQMFGGNGHFHAAGARVFEHIPLEEMQKQIVEGAKKVLD